MKVNIKKHVPVMLLAVWAISVVCASCNRLTEPPSPSNNQPKPALARRLDTSVGQEIEGSTGNSSYSQRVRLAIFNVEEVCESGLEELKACFNSQRNIAFEVLHAKDVRKGALDDFDVVLFPGGSGKRQAAALQPAGRSAVREFVRHGGGYLGICGGAFLATAAYDWSLSLVNAGTITGTRTVAGHGAVSMAARGAGIVSMEFSVEGSKVFSSPARLISVQYSGGPVLSPAGRIDMPAFVSLADYRTEIWAYPPQRGTMVNTPAIIAARFGEGRVIIFSPHPESTPGLEWTVARAVMAVAPLSAAATRAGS